MTYSGDLTEREVKTAIRHGKVYVKVYIKRDKLGRHVNIRS